jgi:RecA/RadA recombinase
VSAGVEQRLGGVCAFIDAEHAMHPLYAGEIGLDVEDLLVSQPASCARRPRRRISRGIAPAP